jgi:exosortase/archaeosortase family protein
MSRPSLHVSARLLFGVGLLALAAVPLIFQDTVRFLEAGLAARLFGFGANTLTVPDANIVWFGLGQPGAFGLRITAECSSALMLAPGIALGAALLLAPRLRASRIVLGLIIASAVAIVGNQIRIGMIRSLIGELGLTSGYNWGHLIVGPAITLFLGAGGIYLLVRIAASGQSHPVVTCRP